MNHELKCHTIYYEKVIEPDLTQRKTVEIRKNDRNFQVGDTLTLIDWNPESVAGTGRYAKVLVTHIVGAPWMENEMVALSILLQEVLADGS